MSGTADEVAAGQVDATAHPRGPCVCDIETKTFSGNAHRLAHSGGCVEFFAVEQAVWLARKPALVAVFEAEGRRGEGGGRRCAVVCAPTCVVDADRAGHK